MLLLSVCVVGIKVWITCGLNTVLSTGHAMLSESMFLYTNYPQVRHSLPTDFKDQLRIYR
jgi:hypothetical protein